MAAPLFLLITVVFTIVMQAGYAQMQLSPGKPPPTAFLVLSLLWVLCLLLAVVAGVIGIFWGRAVLRHIRTVPGAWLGRRRALVALVSGLVTVLIPLALLALSIAGWMAKAGRG